MFDLVTDADSFDKLMDSDAFVRRHIGALTDVDIDPMLATIGVRSIQELISAVVPESIALTSPFADRDPFPEHVVTDMLRTMSEENQPRISLIGMGYTNTITPSVIRRNMLESPAWYTSYTPYQPEISQGRLESLLNFQTVITDLTGLPLANASLLDEATAAAEAMTMARRASRSEANTFFVHADTHPQTIAVLVHRAEPLGIDVVTGDLASLDAANVFGALVSYPSSSGDITECGPVFDDVHRHGSIAIAATDPLACVLLEPPGRLGADIVIGSAQRFGVPLNFGGPHAAFIATTDALARTLPGRLVGLSVDSRGRPALRLALQTREQHIRRERATSNICTAQALLANVAAMYAVWHGPIGLRRIAERVHRLASTAALGLRSGGIETVHDSWFDTIAMRVPNGSHALADRARSFGFDIRVLDADTVSITFDETSTPEHVRSICEIFRVDPSAVLDSAADIALGLQPEHRRQDDILTADVFHRYQSEHEMLRYLRRLSDRDLALDRTMIPLGSCTMKLNASTEMEPITWPKFANVHPFAPPDEWKGYATLVEDLEQMLVEITGYDAVSLQPNAGSQGEFAGLMAIRAFHIERGESHRTVCLIPESAHGTNAASAVMAGMHVKVVRCDGSGNVDVHDIERHIADIGDELAAIMITYPSTHGVFEERIREICDIVHSAGGQVYVDGANLNALVGLAAPGSFGADVSHLNLHKTFCIPHGGGGPGVGPVAVKSHLAPYLPRHPLETTRPRTSGPVSAAPFGSAGILPISWAYITLMGSAGLRRATEHAILNANYIAARLGRHYPVLYTGTKGFVAHECILDIRPITKETSVSVEDIAKRLIDYGFHAPTMSFPVAGTLMIEPTESESKAEIDRFCEAMESIHNEIRSIADGRISIENSPLRHAPHTWDDLASEWNRDYSRAEAFPAMNRGFGYIAPVNRIDAAYGDRNLHCTCAPVSHYAAGTSTSEVTA